MAGQTLYDKIWDQHVVSTDQQTGESLLYIDLHLIHEVTTPQAFAGLRAAGRGVRRPDLTLAVADHNTPTENQALGLAGVRDEAARNHSGLTGPAGEARDARREAAEGGAPDPEYRQGTSRVRYAGW